MFESLVTNLWALAGWGGIVLLPALVVLFLIILVKYPFFISRFFLLGLRNLTGFFDQVPEPGRLSLWQGFIMGIAQMAGPAGLLLSLWMVALFPGALLWLVVTLPLSSLLYRSESSLGTHVQRDGQFEPSSLKMTMFQNEQVNRLHFGLIVLFKTVMGVILPVLFVLMVFVYPVAEKPFDNETTYTNYPVTGYVMFFVLVGLLVPVFAVRQRRRYLLNLYQLTLLVFLVFLWVDIFAYADKSAASLNEIVQSALNLQAPFIAMMVIMVQYFSAMQVGQGVISYMRPSIQSSENLRFGIGMMLAAPLSWLLFLAPLTVLLLNHDVRDVLSYKSLDYLWQNEIALVAFLVLFAANAPVHVVYLSRLGSHRLFRKTSVPALALFAVLTLIAVIVHRETPVTYLWWLRLWKLSNGVFFVGCALALLAMYVYLPAVVYFARPVYSYTRKYLNSYGTSYGLLGSLYMFLLTVLPKNTFSRLVGIVAGLRLPRFMMLPILRLFARHYNVNLDEAELDLKDYNSLNTFFTRALKRSARMAAGGESAVVSPVDGRILEHGPIYDDTMMQVKGKRFSLKSLLGGDEDWAAHFAGGYFCTIYLSPTDYHRIHAPVDCEVISYHYVPGKLFPVNHFAVWSIQDLFSKNERLITYMRHGSTFLAMAKIGATSVGKIRVVYADNFHTNTVRKRKNQRPVSLKEPFVLQKGDELGRFELGSTIILIFPPNSVEDITLERGDKVNFGQPLTFFKEKPADSISGPS